ncbi:MAG: septal ring lytic transglycosylase RlpA family protein [Bacteroidales bacterium]|nr:septal ring lytic transglycosylase RlpA family protein [Bacteroidales bacterium]
MVTRLAIATLALLAAAATASAQNYSHLDTVSVYPNQGTFYHDRFEGRKTASGEVFDQNKFTAAHWRIKLGTHILVTNRNTGLQVIVKVNDRCPKRGVIDLSHRAANAIGIRGCQPVTVRVLPPGYEQRCLAQDARFDSVRTRLPLPPAAAKPAAAPKPDPKPTKEPDTDPIGGYNLLLATVATHGEAFELAQRLPESHSGSLTVDTLEGGTALRLTLELHQSRADADRLRRQLRALYPQARVVMAD